MTPVLHIQLLGDFSLTYGDELLSAVGTERLKSLLALLVLHRNAPQSRQQLAFLCWPDSTEDQARNNLRQSLYRLRQSLPDAERFLRSDTQTIQWLPDSPFRLDVADFEQAARQADSVDSLQYAVNLYHGELLSDCYDDWILAERERLQHTFYSTLDRLIRLLEDQGDYRTAIQHAERMLRSDPLREEAYRQLMRLYMLSGNRTEAARAYHTCVRVLKRELDLEPDPETQAIFEQSQKIRTKLAGPEPSRARASNLPTYLTSFIGREAELEWIERNLSPFGSTAIQGRLLTLTGPGGCGKTRLAVQAASRLIDDFAAGVWFLDVATLADSNHLPHAIAAVLNIPDLPERETLENIIDHLRSKEMLLIFDDCEYFVSTCAQIIEALLLSCPRLRILAISREKLNLPGEKVWPVSTLSLPVESELSEAALSKYDATRLFIERASSVLPTFNLNADNAPSIVQICKRLDGLPLAIELAAARVAVLAPAQIAARLEDIFHTLARASPSAAIRHQTLQAAMDWSHELLSESERTLFRRLSVFMGSFTLESVEAVCANPEVEEGLRASDILDLLSRLIDKSLVTVSDWASGDQLRYRLLQPTWQYALEKLSMSDDWVGARQKHLEYYVSLAEEAELHFTRAEQVEWFNRLLAEHDNLIAAIDWSLSRNELTISLRMIGALWYYWLARGHYKEGLRRLLHTLALAESAAPSYARAKALWSAGALFLWSEGDWRGARPLLEQALAVSRELEDTGLIAGSLGTLGAAAYVQGDYAAAESFLTEGLSLSSESEDHHRTGWLLAYLGDLCLLQHDDERAQGLFERSVEHFRGIEDMNSLAYPIRRLGALALQRGEKRQAVALFRESLRLNREVNYQMGMLACLVALAGAALQQGQMLRVARLYGAAETLLNVVAGKLFPLDRAEFERVGAALLSQLAEASLRAALADGRAMNMEEASDFALKTGET